MELHSPDELLAADTRPLTYRGVVHAWHLDHMGHMNVQHYVGMFDHATWVLLAMMGLDASWFREQNRGMAALEQNIQYKRELRAGDVIEIRSGLLEFGEKKMRVDHEMRHGVAGWVAARTTILAVYFDTAARKSVPFPDVIREKAQGLLIVEA
jgi:acyl-CoA thioester hydrolase